MGLSVRDFFYISETGSECPRTP